MNHSDLKLLGPIGGGEGVVVRRIDTRALAGENLPIGGAQVLLEPGATTAVDRHEECEIWVAMAGSGLLDVDGNLRRFEVGNVVHFSPWQVHRLQNDGTERLAFFSVWWTP